LDFLHFDFLGREFLGNSVLMWLSAALITFLALAVLRFAKTAVARRLRALSERTGNRWIASLAKIIRTTRLILLLAVASWIGSQALDLPQLGENILRHVAVLGMLVQIGIWGNSFIPYLVDTFERAEEVDARTRSATTVALTFVGKLLLWTIVLIVGLENMGVQVSALLTSLGIGGVAVALASKSVLGDILASLSIVFDRPFVVGDFIRTDDLMGNVETIGVRTTRVRSLNGEQVVISNNDLLSSRISNYERMSERRVIFSIGVVYGTTFEKLSRIPDMLRDIIENEDRARPDRFHFKSYGDSSLDFEIVYWIESSSYTTYMDVRQRINFEIFRRFEKEGIEFAYPTQTLYMAQEVPPPSLKEIPQ
jgi:small-conductance mechanosensitive channel